MTTNTAAGATNYAVAEEGLRDIVGPVPVGLDLRMLLLVLAVMHVVGALIAAWLAWRALRKARTSAAGTLAAVLPPHLRARRALEEALRQLDDPDRFCTRVSAILRTYLEERFGLNAPDRTTEEFLAELRTSDELNADQKELLARFLTRCDIVKFARDEPTEAELRALHAAAVRLVSETEPRPLGAPPATVPAAA